MGFLSSHTINLINYIEGDGVYEKGNITVSFSHALAETVTTQAKELYTLTLIM